MASESLKLLVKFPTRQRPERFFNTLDRYYKYLSGKHPVQFVISCDEDDGSMNNAAVRTRLQTYPGLICYFGKSRSKVEAINRDMDKHGDYDILLLASDDMIPEEQEYDDIIVNAFREYFPDLDGVLWFNDGYVGRNLNTLSILGKKYYDRFGYIYHPDYTSLYCDNEFMEVAAKLNRQVYIDRVIIKHDHFYWNKGVVRDALYNRNESYYRIDRKVYQSRKARDFS